MLRYLISHNKYNSKKNSYASNIGSEKLLVFVAIMAMQVYQYVQCEMDLRRGETHLSEQ